MKSLTSIFRSYAEVIDGKHVNGTDKQTNHAYGDAYDSFLNRDAIKLMLEVGVADGSSLLAWREALPNATVVGMDIHPAARWDGEFHLGDQRNKEDCERAAASRQFDLIVEDATHQLDATLLTLFYLWPFVTPGGCYVVEEWADIHSCKQNIYELFPSYGDWDTVQIIDTQGPFGGNEPLVIFWKPL